MKRLSLFAHRLAFAGLPFAFVHEAGFGRAVKRLAVLAHRLAFARLRHRAADSEGSNQSSKNHAPHRCLPFTVVDVSMRSIWPQGGQNYPTAQRSPEAALTGSAI